MVPRRLIVFIATILIVLAASQARYGAATPNPDPGAFWPLEVGIEGHNYSDSLPLGHDYSPVDGTLPTGLSLASDGTIQGVPTQAGSFTARFDAMDGAGIHHPIRVSVTVVKAPGPIGSGTTGGTPSFESEGPLTWTEQNLNLTVRNPFDGASVDTVVRLVLPNGPAGTGGPWPLLMFHRGRGFDHDDYKTLHGHIASYGIAVASVEDQVSFSGGSFSTQNYTYDSDRPELGMESASGVIEAVGEWFLSRSGDPGDILYDSFDPENIFFAGHSRGGGAVHGSHERAYHLRYKGVIYLMPFDLRFFVETVPPGLAPAYPIGDETPRIPSLIITAENDGDLIYPIADQLIDRATGPTTQVTLYGAVHNLIGDDNYSEGNDKIQRATEQKRTADWMICFLRRWIDFDPSLDQRLYGGAHQTSTKYAVSSWRPSSRTLMIEDSQDGDIDRHILGAHKVMNLRRREESIYPPYGNMDSLNIRHTVLTPVDDQSSWRLLFDTPIDATTHQNLVLRMAQTSGAGWSWVEFWAGIQDENGVMSHHMVTAPNQVGYLPEFNGFSPNDRFIDVFLPLADFIPAASGFDPTKVTGIEFLLAVHDNQVAEDVVIDAIRLD